MSTLKDFDVGELVLHLHRDLNHAFDLIRVEQENSLLYVDQVKAKLGRNQLKIQESSISENNLLNPDRYPDEEDWEIEVSYSANSSVKKPGIQKGKLAENYLLMNKMGTFTLQKLKGIDKYWNSFFRNKGITNLEQLAFLEEQEIIRLCKISNSLLPKQFQTQVLLLVCKVTPFRYFEFREKLLIDLVLKTVDELKKDFKGKITALEIYELKKLASLIFMVIDNTTASKLTLEIFD